MINVMRQLTSFSNYFLRARENETNQIHCLEHTMVVTLFWHLECFYADY